MKKYIGVMTTASNWQTSGIKTKEDATQWARQVTMKNGGVKAYVCEIISEVSRPDPVVIVKPYVPEPEKTPEDK